MSRTPALHLWRSELAAGKRTATQFDVLWRLACLDASAREAEELGLPLAAEHLRHEARGLLRAAHRRRKAGA